MGPTVMVLHSGHVVKPPSKHSCLHTSICATVGLGQIDSLYTGQWSMQRFITAQSPDDKLLEVLSPK